MQTRLTDLSLRDFAERLGSADPTPGGGSAAAYAGALGAALAGMVGRIALKRETNAALTDIVDEADGLRAHFIQLVQDDSAAFDRVTAALSLPKRTTEEKSTRKEALQAALLAAARVPLDAAKAGRRLLALCERLLEHATATAISDAGVAALLAETALRGAALNVMINLASLADATHVKALSEELDRAVDGADALRATVVERVEAKIAR
ncbi:MAG: cyclodeaminase/cyclohydrolase family protein [Chloroflexi bacterium]|nr:MAG: cyclodeaminase/cyclohydrolase family protein [Chloroflexota bacterium]